MAVDEEEFGRRKRVKWGEGGLRAEELVFVTRKEGDVEGVGGIEGDEWNEERWEYRAMHIKRMELIKRTTALIRLMEPSAMKTFDVLATALTRNKAQLFPTGRRPKLRELDISTEIHTVRAWFEKSEIRIGKDLTDEQQEKVQRLLYT